MAMLPAKGCSFPGGCPELVNDRKHSLCPKHQAEKHRKLDQRRGTRQSRGYGTEHERWRKQILLRDPICKACDREWSNTADHVIPKEQGGAAYDLANGQGMCERCHNRKRAEEQRLYPLFGAWLLKRGESPEIPLDARRAGLWVEFTKDQRKG